VSDRRAAGVEDFADRSREITHAGARHDDRVPPSVRFLGDAQKPAAIVFAVFHVKPLPLDLEFFRFDDAVHFPEKRRSLGGFAPAVEANSAAVAGIGDPGPKWRENAEAGIADPGYNPIADA
jgi:hypothetical protein